MSYLGCGYLEAVPPEYIRAKVIRLDSALAQLQAARLLTYADGTVRFEHLCKRPDRGTIVCAPALQLGNGHTLTYDEHGERPTVRASVLCEDCGLHGWITAGKWTDA